MSEIEFKEPCGGCGQKYASKRCFGCHHEMMAAAPAPVISAGDLVERAAEIIWNDLYGARAGAWDNPPADSVAGIQMRATAAAALSEATARIQTLEAALKPFAEAADVFAREYPAMLEKPATSCGIRFDALQAARYSLNQDGGKP